MNVLECCIEDVGNEVLNVDVVVVFEVVEYLFDLEDFFG